jgi:hypothetical protein
MRFAKIGLIAGLVLLPTGRGGFAAAQPQQTASERPEQDDSLAAAARRAREQKKQQPKATKVWNNDDIPKSAPLSLVGQPAPAAENTQNPPANGETAAKQGGDPAKKPSAADVAAVKDQLQTLQNDLDILQRKLTLDQQSFSSKPGYSLDNSGAATLKTDQDQIDAKLHEISDAQKTLEDLETKPTASPATQPVAGSGNRDSASGSTQTVTTTPNQGTAQPKTPN